ncbi:GspE/PulE family protein [Ammoniphilus sp. CFH 90114]|uniref:GspE/PulE family protein n=1 Tax=Ammoniphilus sp. CFH 90114 TaxID=2493665 RepID=UPI00100F9C1A|nr:ATPase, T2SS/T4P/T4SS family [Ammoniphilus sp. CFH 90114]RXT14690.1 type II secretion system protein GspE [Ammoniphilus sp. CFH 90114]
MKQTRKRLGDLLIEAELITEEQLQKALKDKSPTQRLGDALLQQGLITEQQLIEVLEFQLGIPHVTLFRYPIDASLTHLVSKDFVKRNLLMPLKREGDKLFVAMADPMDYFAIDDLRLTTGFQIEPAIAAKDEILKAINKYYQMDATMEEFMVDLPTKIVGEEQRVTEEDSPIVKLVNQILLSAVQHKASDIHFDPHETKLVIRFRMDGELHTERTLPKHMQSVLTARIKIMANLNITEQRIPQDGRIKINLEFHPIDLRVSTLPTVYGEKIVLRVLDLGSSLNDLDKLGFNKLHLERYQDLIKRPNGIILITGPTGSGKSATLYATLNRLNTDSVNIITIEDPVEYQLEGVNQLQVNANVGMTFAKGLRAILRQDPNIIMVGEIRDTETAEIAIRAALTGHLVLSTLHTNDAIGTITRLVDMGIEPFLVASSVSGIVSQRLIRKVCRDCRQVRPPSEREKDIFAKRGLTIDRIAYGKGCGTCNDTGFKGRIAIHEILILDDEVRKMIMNEKPITTIRDYAIRNGMVFLLDDGLLKVKQGLTTTEEILRVAIQD